MKIFITGSSGFIGFHLTKKLLEKKIKVHGYDSMNNFYDIKLKNSRLKILKRYKNFSFSKNTLENDKVLNKAISNFKPTIIIHLAAQAGVRYSIENPDKYLNSNILGTFNIIKCAEKIKVKHLIIGSSSSVYGANKKTPFQEIDKTEHQISFYAATKKSTESLAHSYSSLWKLPITMLRFFTVYGPWGRPDMAYFKFTKKIIKNEKIDIFNRGNHFRDFTYVSDIIRFIDTIVKKKENRKFEILNLGSNNPKKLGLFIKLIEKKLNKKSKKNYIKKQSGDMHGTHADMKKSIDNYNLKYKVDLEKGINQFIDWYIKYKKIKKI